MKHKRGFQPGHPEFRNLHKQKPLLRLRMAGAWLMMKKMEEKPLGSVKKNEKNFLLAGLYGTPRSLSSASMKQWDAFRRSRIKLLKHQLQLLNEERALLERALKVCESTSAENFRVLLLTKDLARKPDRLSDADEEWLPDAELLGDGEKFDATRPADYD